MIAVNCRTYELKKISKKIIKNYKKLLTKVAKSDNMIMSAIKRSWQKEYKKMEKFYDYLKEKNEKKYEKFCELFKIDPEEVASLQLYVEAHLTYDDYLADKVQARYSIHLLDKNSQYLLLRDSSDPSITPITLGGLAGKLNELTAKNDYLEKQIQIYKNLINNLKECKKNDRF